VGLFAAALARFGGTAGAVPSPYNHPHPTHAPKPPKPPKQTTTTTAAAAAASQIPYTLEEMVDSPERATLLRHGNVGAADRPHRGLLVDLSPGSASLLSSPPTSGGSTGGGLPG
jgi:hypothetical protein